MPRSCPFYLLSFSCLLIVFNSCVQERKHEAKPPKHTDTSLLAHRSTGKLFYDTQFYKRPEPVNYADEDYKELRSTAQYRYWLRRKRNIKTWTKQYAWLELPDSAQVMDVKHFKAGQRQRTIVAWMENCSEYIGFDDGYTCPEVTMGLGYLVGKLSYSLVDDQKHQLINSIKIHEYDDLTYRRGDTITYDQSYEYFTYPFSIANPKYRSTLGGLTYFAHGGNDTTDGEADMLHFVDYNNDGKAYEWGLFIQEACMGKASTLLSYNDQTDRLDWNTWYMTNKWTVNGKDTTWHSEDKWIDYAVIYKFDKKGELGFEIDYRGRGGSMNRYSLRYDKTKSRYSGTLDMRELPGDTTKLSWYTTPQLTE